MKYVLDSSVAFKWVLPELYTDKALLLRDDYRNGVHELFAPDIFPVEIIHALTKAERQGRIAPPQGGVHWHDVMKTAPLLIPSIPLVPRAYAIASQAKIGVYDCLHVALSEKENCRLVTADDKLVKVLQPSFPWIVHLASFP
jgi:predicted nucleic acid-binding protein